MRGEKLRIVFSGMIAADPYQGGATWAVLQYLLGLKRLGHDVTFLEPLDPKALKPTGSTLLDSSNADYFRQVVSEFGLKNGSALLLAGTRETVGVPYSRLEEKAREADLLLNVSGMLTDPALIEPIPLRAYLDLDPAFVQLWQFECGIDMRFRNHNRFVTVGLALGSPECIVPTGGLDWITTPQPVVLDHWPKSPNLTHDGWTTVGNWRGYGSIEYRGRFLGQKAHSLRPLMALPTRTKESLMPALRIHPDETKDLEALAANGWKLLDPDRVTATPDEYRRFIQGSKAEFGIAKSGYVVTRCGWFSDRSACYLAAGKPVLAQETGFSRYLPTGSGLLPFETEEDALAGLEEIRSKYASHSQAARDLAEAVFDSDRVLNRLLERVCSENNGQRVETDIDVVEWSIQRQSSA